MINQTLYLGEIWHTPTAPASALEEPALVAFEDGALVVDAAGVIVAVGEAAVLQRQFAAAAVVDFRGRILLPGFVDAHVHFPQMDMIGSYGQELLGWLDAFTYPHEMTFSDPAVAAEAAGRFVTELLAHGTSLAAVYATSHLESATALLAEAERRGVRMIVGKVSMDRAAPAALLQDAAADARDNRVLIESWHGRDGRLFVALTPRFALSCTEDLLASHGRLRQQYPDVYVQTHHAENQAEIAAVRQLFPADVHYLGVYDRFGLVGPRTVLGHCVHSEPAEVALMAQQGAAVAHCPSSNQFLGSGLFPLRRYRAAGVRVALGSDVGAGTSLAQLRTMGDGYKVQRLLGDDVTPAMLLYLATLGGAAALSLDHVTGSFAPGKEADFQVLDPRRSRLLAVRFNKGKGTIREEPEQRLFALMALGDDRLTETVYVRGRRVYDASR